MNSKEKNERLSLALKKNLKKRKLFQKRLRRKVNNVSSFRQVD
jgi:hypothetical protein